MSIDTLTSTGLMNKLVIEVIVCLLHSPPGINMVLFVPNSKFLIPYSLDTFLTFFPLMRVFLLYRVFTGSSFWADERSERVCREICHTEGGTLFTLKCEMKERPFTITLFMLIILIFVFGFDIRSAEL